MSGAEKRTDPRRPAVLRVKLKHATLDAFIEAFAENVTNAGLLLPGKNPKPIGTEVRFDLILADGTTALKGEGRVAWITEFDPEDPARAHGMGIKFLKLPQRSRDVVERCVAWRRSRPVGATMTTAVFGRLAEAAQPAAVPDAASHQTSPEAKPGMDALEALVLEHGLGEPRLARTLRDLRALATSGDSDLDALLEPEPPIAVSFEDARRGLDALLTPLARPDDQPTAPASPPSVPPRIVTPDLGSPRAGAASPTPPPLPQALREAQPTPPVEAREERKPSGFFKKLLGK